MTWKKSHGGPMVPSEYVWVPEEADGKRALIAVVWADGSVALGRSGGNMEACKICMGPEVLIGLGAILADLKVAREAVAADREQQKGLEG
ncbi:MAG: hypothetical protein O7G84_13840 [Gammaproteobacteria bacterium]|nr:hypothetical protein [Gammaproteobacteria bacterium]